MNQHESCETKNKQKLLKKATRTWKQNKIITMMKKEEKNRQNAWRKNLNPALNHAAITRKNKLFDLPHIRTILNIRDFGYLKQILNIRNFRCSNTRILILTWLRQISNIFTTQNLVGFCLQLIKFKGLLFNFWKGGEPGLRGHYM